MFKFKVKIWVQFRSNNLGTGPSSFMERAPAAGHKTLSNARPLCKYFLFKKAKIDFCHLTFDILLSKKVQIVVQ